MATIGSQVTALAGSQDVNGVTEKTVNGPGWAWQTQGRGTVNLVLSTNSDAWRESLLVSRSWFLSLKIAYNEV